MAQKGGAFLKNEFCLGGNPQKITARTLVVSHEIDSAALARIQKSDRQDSEDHLPFKKNLIFNSFSTRVCPSPMTYSTISFRYRYGLLLVFLALLMSMSASALAQNVEAFGDVNPFPSPNPTNNWDLGGGGLRVGENAFGELVISNGGSVYNVTGATLGHNVGAEGNVTITGSELQANAIVIGRSGDGELSILDGGFLSSSAMSLIGLTSGSSGRVHVTDSGSIWEVGGNLSVGVVGHGEVDVNNGGIITTAGDGLIAEDSAATGSVIISNVGSQWNVDGDIYVGSGGDGQLSIYDGGSVTAITGLIGVNSGSTGIAIVDGSGSEWALSTSLGVGISGDGELQIRNGGLVSAEDLMAIGYLSGSSGEVLVTGANSELYSSHLIVGNYGDGEMLINDGGYVYSSGNGIIGYQTGGYGSVTVSNSNSVWAIGDTLAVGAEGVGELNISDGGSVEIANDAYISYAANGAGEVTVEGLGSQWAIGGTLSIGEGDYGALTVLESGYVEVNLDTYVSNGSLLTLGKLGRLSVAEDFYMGNISAIEFILSADDVNGGDSFITTGGSFFGDGTLNISPWGDYTPQDGDIFQLFDILGGWSGQFTNVNLYNLGGGYSWNTSHLYTDGYIQVLGGESVPETSTWITGLLLLCGAMWTVLRRHHKKHLNLQL